MSKVLSTIRVRLIVLFLVLLLATLALEFYLPSLLQGPFYNSVFQSAEAVRGIEIVASFLYKAISAAIVAVFVTEAIRVDERQQNKDELTRQITDLKNSAIESVYARTVDPEIWSILDEEIFQSEVQRKRMRVTLRFEVKNGRVYEEMTWDEDYYNRTDKDIVHSKVISASDHDDRCVLHHMEYFFHEKNSEVSTVVFDRNESAAISHHTAEIPIRSGSYTKVRCVYSLNLGFSDRYYQNSIGVSQAIIGVQIDVYKPPGYLFAIESYFGRLKSSLSFDFSDHKSVNARHLTFFTSRALFPGTGIEYTLEKVEDPTAASVPKNNEKGGGAMPGQPNT